MPVFVDNFQYHLAHVELYSDGVVGAWGLLDLPLFEAKLRSGWIATRAPESGRISVHNLGLFTSHKATWRRSLSDVQQDVEQALARLNPSRQDLVDLHGAETEMQGGISTYKLGLGNGQPCRYRADGSRIEGRQVPVFWLRDGRYTLTRLFVFADARVRIGLADHEVDLATLPDLFRAQILTTYVDDGTEVDIDGLGTTLCTQGNWSVQPQDRVAEIWDLARQLSGERSSISVCRDAFEVYNQKPSPDSRETLRQAYDAVPAHLRMYCGDMDAKDGPIRRALGRI
jgi:hypothetical protein